MKLNSLSPAEGSKKSRKRVGRGMGSGIGKEVTFRWLPQGRLRGWTDALAAPSAQAWVCFTHRAL